MSLYNEARPNTFAEMEGDYSYLQKIVEREGHSHTFLFWGYTKGTGKTTVSRILAEQLGADPMDIREYNFSKDNGIETVRELMEGLYLSPIGKVRVYIIDEFQGATSAAQKALRKNLEEPPAHVYFFLCTNEIEKVDDAIANRATKVEFKPLSEKQLTAVIKKAIFRLGIVGQIDPLLYPLIAQKAEGSARDALNIVEGVLAVPVEDREAFIEKYSPRGIHPGLDSLANTLYGLKGWKQIAPILNELTKEHLDPEKSRRYMLTYGTREGIWKASPVAMEMASVFTETTFYNEWNGFMVLCYKAYKISRE